MSVERIGETLVPPVLDHTPRYQKRACLEEKIRLLVETDRTWQPLKVLGIPDPRRLGVGIGEVWFKYPDRIPEERVASIQRIPFQNWEGIYKDKLWGDGISRLRFKTDQRHVALRFYLKGTKAFGIGPYLVIRIDESLIARTMLTSEYWTSLVFTPDIPAGKHIFSVE